MILFRAKLFLWFLLRGKTRYYIHSPFVYDFCNSVIRKRISNETIGRIRQVKSYYNNKKDNILLKELGAGPAGDHKVTVSAYFRKTAISDTYGALLLKIVEHYDIKQVIECGTGLGISAYWMSQAANQPAIVSIEGNKPLVDQTDSMLKHHSLSHVKLIHGSVDEQLPLLAKQITSNTLIFLDANHTREATLRYVEQIIPHVSNDTILVLDDINYSEAMYEAWRSIIQHPRVTLSINLWRLGVIFFRPELSKQEFYLYH